MDPRIVEFAVRLRRSRGAMAAAWVSLSVSLAGFALAAALIANEAGRSESTSLEQRIDRLASSLGSAATDIDEIEREIAERQALVQELREAQQTYERLAELDRAQVEAIVQTLEGEIADAGRRSFWENFWLGLAFLFAGVMLDRLVTWGLSRWRFHTAREQVGRAV